MTRKTVFQAFVYLCITVILGAVIWAAWREAYLEAVAISCVGPVFLWFMTGIGRSREIGVSKPGDDNDAKD